jgi:hypothetical protein
LGPAMTALGLLAAAAATAAVVVIGLRTSSWLDPPRVSERRTARRRHDWSGWRWRRTLAAGRSPAIPPEPSASTMTRI